MKKLRMAQIIFHKNCRNGLYPSTNVERYRVPEERISWSEDYPNYDPPEYTSPGIRGKPWADPDIADAPFKPQWNDLDGNVDRRSYTLIKSSGKYRIDNEGRPLNPIGRTGITGRGVLGRWGPNHAADPIVTRWKKESIDGNRDKKRILQFIGIQRRDTKQWAIPGGMVDAGEQVSSTLKREFLEEALNSMEKSEAQLSEIKNSINKLFEKGETVYRGYVDDPRNTDNAWMETTAVNFHDDDGHILGNIPLEAGDDACGVRWLDINEKLDLYANHAEFIKLVANLRDSHW